MSKKKSHLEQIYEGKTHWYVPGLQISCCDCMLTHRYKMGIKERKNGKQQIWFRVWAMPKSTKSYRKEFKPKLLASDSTAPKSRQVARSRKKDRP